MIAEAEEVRVENRALLTDLYQLTMNAGYFANKKNDLATFDLFVRKLPKYWGFFIANGIEDAIDYATNIKFEDDDIEYLKDQRLFSEDYLRVLKDLRFTGEIYVIREGTPVAPNTPLLRITAPRMEAQLLETMLLNTVNFQTMIATKANRVVNAAAPAKVVDFGLRRAQEKDAALKGARNAAIVGKELEAKGKRLGAVRLDSGDLADLSKQVRTILDQEDLQYVKIFASNDLNEYKIAELKARGAKIDGYGVGTELITAKPTAAIPGVYKLVEDESGGKIKLST